MTKYYTPSDGDDIRRFLEQCNDELWNLRDVADYYGITEQRVSNWKRRYDGRGFPTPVIEKNKSNIYLKSEMQDFIELRYAPLHAFPCHKIRS